MNSEKERKRKDEEDQVIHLRKEKAIRNDHFKQGYFVLLKRQGIPDRHVVFELARMCKCGLTKAYELKYKWSVPEYPLSKEELEAEVSRIQSMTKEDLNLAFDQIIRFY